MLISSIVELTKHLGPPRLISSFFSTIDMSIFAFSANGCFVVDSVVATVLVKSTKFPIPLDSNSFFPR